jgi:AraC-like DNA-binding protein
VLATDLHYVDYSHFSRRYKEVVGETPDQTRARARANGR